MTSHHPSSPSIEAEGYTYNDKRRPFTFTTDVDGSAEQYESLKEQKRLHPTACTIVYNVSAAASFPIIDC